MNEIILDTRITLDDLAQQIHYLDESDIIDFIMNIDDLMCDESFTKTLRKRLKQALKDNQSPSEDTDYPYG